MKPIPREVLAAVYTEFDTPADQLLTDNALAERFTGRVQEVLGEQVDQRSVLSRLLSLRKKALLPRLRS